MYVAPRQESIMFEVWDTGIGISKEDQKKLFEEFAQVDNKYSRQFDGTGLGLLIVKKLAELHGGDVTVKSTKGWGSRFTVSIPWEPEVVSEFKVQEIEERLVSIH